MVTGLATVGGYLAEFDAAGQQMLEAYHRAEAALERMDSAPEVLEGRDDAERAAVLARMAGYNEIADKWKVLVIRHERKWAKLTPKAQGKRTDLTSAPEGGSCPAPTDKSQRLYREVEAIPDDVFETAAAAVLERGDVTRAGLVRAAERIMEPAPDEIAVIEAMESRADDLLANALDVQDYEKAGQLYDAAAERRDMAGLGARGADDAELDAAFGFGGTGADDAEQLKF